MKKTIARVLFLNLVVIFAISCSTHTHTIGEGSMTGKEVSQRQWYIAYGLAPLNKVDTNEMAGDAENYEIITQTSFVDGLINIFTGNFTVTCRTVTVVK